MQCPICVAHQPGSDRMLIITEPYEYSPTTLHRFTESEDTSELETLYSWKQGTAKGTAYSIVFHPQFAKNGYVFIGWNGTTPDDKVFRTRVTRFHIDPKPPYRFDPASAKEIFAVASAGHNGGALAFDRDGMFYVTTGDGTGDSDTDVVGQRMDTLLSKLLRLDVDHPDPGKTYSVPKDNPFVGKEGCRPETWAYGFRNPWRLTIDEKTGHIWVGQNGQDLWEQAYLIHKGDNYGWSVNEGSHPFYPERKRGPDADRPADGRASPLGVPLAHGGIVYYGKKHPDLQGPSCTATTRPARSGASARRHQGRSGTGNWP